MCFFLMAKSYSTGKSPSAMSLMLLLVMLMASLDITGLSLSLSLLCYTLCSKIKTNQIKPLYDQFISSYKEYIFHISWEGFWFFTFKSFTSCLYSCTPYVKLPVTTALVGRVSTSRSPKANLNGGGGLGFELGVAREKLS